MGQRTAWGWLAAWVGLVLLAPTAAAGDAIPRGANPLPVNKTTTVRGMGTTWYVDGPTVIPPNVELRIELGTKIVGINGASLEVQGGLKVHGTQEHWVVMKDIDFSPTSKPKRGFHLDMVDFRNCKFEHGEAGAFDGDLTIENSCFQRDCTFKFRIRSGFLKIMTVEFGMPCHVVFDPHEKQRPIEFELRSSWMKEVTLTGPSHANLRHSEIRGGLVAKNVDQVVVDGCDFGDDMEFHQAENETFKRIKLTKCNMWSGCCLVLKRPAGPKTKRERVRLDKFYFGPKEGRDGVLLGKKAAACIKDGLKEPDGKGTVTAAIGKTQKRKHLLVNYETLRQRPPPLR